LRAFQSPGAVTTFFVGNVLYGVPSIRVREIIRVAHITPVPLVSPALRGVFNVRGELVTALDLRVRLGLPDAGTEPAVHVLFPTAEGTMSLLVDREGDVLDIDPALFEQPPGGLSAIGRDCVMGAYRLPQELLIVLDADRTLDVGAGPGGPDPSRMMGGTQT
jgi:purine-binding chemotaxis protein CheW